VAFWRALGLLLASCIAASAQPQTPESLARDLQKKYDGINDFSADFVHSYRGGVLKQQATESGRMMVRKPGKMRWDYTAPEKKTFVSDGHKMYAYLPKDRQVIVSTVPASHDQAATPALFLAGTGNIARDYEVAFDKVPEAPAGSLALRLTPRKREAEYDWLTLVVEPGTLRLRMLITVDPQGGRSAFTFTNLKENAGLADTLFVFKMPRNVDVDVVTDGGAK
jgi:outer membrane lipoprotein carrier protein